MLVRTICFTSEYFNPYVCTARKYSLVRLIRDTPSSSVASAIGHFEHAIDQKRMILSADAKNHVVARQADFDHDVLGRHFVQQFVWMVFVHYVYAMPDTFGVSGSNGECDVIRGDLRKERDRARVLPHAE